MANQIRSPREYLAALQRFLHCAIFVLFLPRPDARKAAAGAIIGACPASHASGKHFTTIDRARLLHIRQGAALSIRQCGRGPRGRARATHAGKLGCNLRLGCLDFAVVKVVSRPNNPVTARVA